jgi:integrase
LHEAGGLNYDHIQGEFQRLARRLGWPPPATLKDLRHLFATTLHNAALPESYRRYLLGQSPGQAALVAYTHLNELRHHLTAAAQRAWQPLLSAILQRVQALTTTSPAP